MMSPTKDFRLPTAQGQVPAISPELDEGQADTPMDRGEFSTWFRNSFVDSELLPEDSSFSRLEDVAWDAFVDGCKTSFTQRAGAGYAFPDYELSIEWLAARHRIEAARQLWALPETPSRVLLICGSAGNDASLLGEKSRSFQMLTVARDALERAGLQADVLDLSQPIAEDGRKIYPCKGCASTAMPLCHWPCSCYPNQALGQHNDWMNEIYERLTAAHAVVIVLPTYWHQSQTPLKLMMDRLVCADGGNPDPTSTHGKRIDQAKALEMAGWDYPQHLAGRAYGLVVHGETAGVEASRRALSDRLDCLGLIDAGKQAPPDHETDGEAPDATNFETPDENDALKETTRFVAKAVVRSVEELRSGRLRATQVHLPHPRPT